MAKVTAIVCDMHGSTQVPATQTRTFRVDGNAYTLDLCVEDARAMDRDLAKWIKAAGKSAPQVSTNGHRPAVKRPSTTPKRLSSRKISYTAVRAWARENGVKVNARGRIPTDVVEAYQSRSKAAPKRSRRTTKSKAQAK